MEGRYRTRRNTKGKEIVQETDSMRQENMRKITDPRQVPHDLSDEEQLEFWETHEITEEFLTKTEEVPADERPRRRERTKSISLRLDESKIKRLKAIAEMRDIGYQTLIKEFITERLYEEEKRIGLLSPSSDLAPTVQINESEQAQQQRALQKLAQDSMNAYMQFLNTRASYVSQQASQQQQQQFQQLQQMSQQWVNSYMSLFDAQLSYVQEAGRRAQGQPPIKDYDELSVQELSERLDDLSVEEIEEVKEYERRNQNRQTLLKQMDQKINATF